MKRRKYKQRLGLLIVLAFVLYLDCVAAQEDPAFPEFQLPGRLESTGTHFELADSEYLNITLDSSEPIELVLESMPEMVTIQVESATDAALTEITIRGFPPLTTYHKYEDDYHDHTAFMTDESGSYSFTQDLSVAHIIFIQPRPSTKFIRDDETGGDCYLVGTWNSTAKTCTLAEDVTGTIQIDSDGITLDGNGHIITGNETSHGIYLSGRTGVTIRNVEIRQFTNGIHLYNSSNNNITGNIMSSNACCGIYLTDSNDNVITNNTANSNKYGIFIYSSSGNILNNNNANSNSVSGIFICSSSNNTLSNNDVSSNQYGIVLRSSTGITLNSNTANSNSLGVFLYYSSDNTVTNNVANSNELYGIVLSHSNDNNLSNNSASSNSIGIYPYYSNSNSLTGNTANSNTQYGIFLIHSSNNTVTDNTAKSNSHSGIFLGSSSYNILTNNIAKSNSYGIYLDYSNGNTLDSNANSDGGAGIILQSSSNNTLTNNNNSNSYGYGIWLDSSSSNTLTNNTVNSNNVGIDLTSSSSNTLTNNTAANSNICGVSLLSSNSNTIYNNYFNNTQNFNLEDSPNNTWNTTRALGTNIVGGPYLGGNFWAYPNGTGFSETCTDVDSDGICDSSYTLNSENVDYLPVAVVPPPITVSWDVRVYVQNSDNEPVANANVIVLDNTGGTVFSGLTNSLGYTGYFAAVEYVQSLAGNTTFNPHNVTASIADSSSSVNVTVNQTQTITVTLDSTATGASANSDVAITNSSAAALDLVNSTGVSLDILGIDNLLANITVTSYSGSPTACSSGFGTPLGIYFEVDVSDNINSTSGNLSWVMLKSYYTQEQLDSSGLSESSLQFNRYNESTCSWVALSPGSPEYVYDTGVNTTDVAIDGNNYSGYIWANLSHFSVYGISGTIVSAGSQPSSSYYGGSGGTAPPVGYLSSGVEFIKITSSNFDAFLKQFGYITRQFYAVEPELAGVFASLDLMPSAKELSTKISSETVTPVQTVEGDAYSLASERVLAKHKSAPKVVIARGDLSADSIAAASFARALNVPMLLVKPNEIPEATLDALEKLGTNEVVVVGNEIAVSEGVVAQLPNAARIGGKNREETAVKLAEALMEQKTIDTVILTDSINPDIAAFIAAVKYDAPVIYTSGDELPSETEAFLKKNAFKRVVVAGISIVAEGRIKAIV